MTKSYASIITFSKETRNKHIDLKDKRIESSAQSPGGQIVFRSGKHKLFALEARNSRAHEVADFTSERSKLKINQEAMAIGMPNDGLVLAVWAGIDGGLTLKQVEVAGNSKEVRGLDLRDIYFRVCGGV